MLRRIIAKGTIKYDTIECLVMSKEFDFVQSQR